MSKAFTRESDDLPERPAVPRPRASLPAGTRNYVTPDGAERLRSELDQLEAAGPAGDSRSVARIQALRHSLQTAEITPAPSPPHDQVRFGACVTVRDSGGLEETFRLVGIDETDPERDWISWLSPLARALMNAHLGQKVRLQLPGGPRELEIVRIDYL
jgi:transcription elongation factor GreB